MLIRHNRRLQRGISLIEVLVATVILAVGMLGIAGLQVVSLQQNRSSMMRSEALQLGNDILDRMRANSEQDYSGLAFDDPPPAGAGTCVGVGADCTAAEMMLYDQAVWKCALDPLDGENVRDVCTTVGVTTARLPQGEGDITQDANGVHIVEIRWVDDGEGNTRSVTLRTRAD